MKTTCEKIHNFKEHIDEKMDYKPAMSFFGFVVLFSYKIIIMDETGQI